MAFKAPTSNEITAREINNMDLVKNLAAECAVLLENDGTLPLRQTGKIALFGNGARHTVRGGTGSGEVNARYVVSVCEGLEQAGFEITTTGWFDRYDAILAAHTAEYKQRVEDYAKEKEVALANAYFENCFGTPALPRIEEGDVDTSADTAIYVIARASGEGADRKPEPGDYYLTEDEEYNIDFVCEHYAKVIVLLNVGGVIDMNYLKREHRIGAILLISQTGSNGGNVAADLITGKATPSGKLTDTWARSFEDYPSSEDFMSSDEDDRFYREGIYVGYRYFDSFGIAPIYPFGYGKSYTTFGMNVDSCEIAGDLFTVNVTVSNTGAEFAGKQIIQIYFSAPEGRNDRPYQELIAFAKTSLLAPGASETLTIKFKPSDMACYDSYLTSRVLEAGDYLVRVGVSSRETKICAVIRVADEITVEKLNNHFPDDPQYRFEDMRNPGTGKEMRANLDGRQLAEAPVYELEGRMVRRRTVRYGGVKEELVDGSFEEDLTLRGVLGHHCGLTQVVAKLSVEELAELCVGKYSVNIENGVVFSASSRVPGAASETCDKFMTKRGIDPIVMADGPAGLRLQPHFKATPETSDEDEKLLPGGEVFGMIDNPFPEDTPEDAIDYYQYCTAIPIATALAQTWNMDIIEKLGHMVGTEMEEFGVQLWLAPGMNIHRNPLCGRNFEYYSEDPLLTGLCAAADTRGVQSVEGRGVTIKHFACNNNELNRMFSNSHVSEKALRDLYLKGFEICIKEEQPWALMASYNLINGTHTANSYELLTNVLRDEWDFEGVVMTDWYSSFADVNFLGYNKPDYKYPTASSRTCVYAGCDLQMPGCPDNVSDIIDAVRDNKISKADLQGCVMNILRLCLKCI